MKTINSQQLEKVINDYVNSSLINSPLLVAFGKYEAVVPLDHLIVVRIDRTDQHGAFQQPQFDIRLHEYAAGQVASYGDFQHTSAMTADEIDGGLDRPGV